MAYYSDIRVGDLVQANDLWLEVTRLGAGIVWGLPQGCFDECWVRNSEIVALVRNPAKRIPRVD